MSLLGVVLAFFQGNRKEADAMEVQHKKNLFQRIKGFFIDKPRSQWNLFNTNTDIEVKDNGSSGAAFDSGIKPSGSTDYILKLQRRRIERLIRMKLISVNLRIAKQRGCSMLFSIAECDN